MKLVNIHKLLLMLAMAFGIKTVQAQSWSLEKCIDSAKVYNKNLQINRNNIELSEQKQKEAKAHLNPKITANADYRYFINLPYQLLPLSALNPSAPQGEFREAQFGVPHNINANLQLTMTLYNPELYGAIQKTQIAHELSELQYQKSEEQVFFEISNLFYNAQILQHQMSFVDSNLVNAIKLLDNIQLLQEELLATENDVNKVELQLAQLTTQRENVYSKYRQVINTLKFMMGLDMVYNLEIEKDIVYLESISYPSKTSLDLLIIRSQQNILSSELATLRKSKYLPRLNLFATYGTTGFGYDGKPESFLNFYPIGFAGLQLSYPLFDGLLTQVKIKQKTIELENKELQYSLQSEQTSMQIDNANSQISLAKSTIKTTGEQIKLAQSLYEHTLLQQKHGIAKLTDVLYADNALREAQHAYLSGVVEYLKAELELKRLSNQLRITN